MYYVAVPNKVIGQLWVTVLFTRQGQFLLTFGNCSFWALASSIEISQSKCTFVKSFSGINKIFFYSTAPSAPSFIHFSELTTTSVNMSWGEPKQPNGIVEGYRVVYEPCTPVDGENLHHTKSFGWANYWDNF